MKTQSSKQLKQSKHSVRLKDIKPKRDAKGGVLIGMLLPAVQKVQTVATRQTTLVQEL